MPMINPPIGELLDKVDCRYTLAVEAAKRALYTGHYGDGKIFVSNVDNVIKIRTGEEGFDALQDKEIQ